MLTLHDFLPSGNGYKCRLLLSFLGIPFKLEEYDILSGASRTPAFLEKRNANGRIPVLELEDGTHLSESGAILAYLAEGTPYLPETRIEKARVFQWLFFEQYSLEPNIAVRRFWLTEQSELTSLQEAQLPDKLAQGYAALDVLERGLATGDWLVGDQPTIADIALYGYTHVSDEGGYTLERHPRIQGWLARIAGLPGYAPITRRDFPA